jgi:arylsulfatase A-like enzyme
LQDLGVTFTNHTITSNMRTPSRSTIYTGQHIQRTTVFDNVNFPWSNDLPTVMPTIGHRMRDLGYYSAYLGKWHLSEALDTTDMYAGANPEFGAILDEYGFSDFVGPRDVIGMTQGGYRSDEMIGAAARRWLRVRGQDLASEGTPWFLAINLVNPHDAMMFDTDLPATRHEAWDAPGRPAAHREYQEARRFLTGLIPDEDDRWQRFQDYYLNCIRHKRSRDRGPARRARRPGLSRRCRGDSDVRSWRASRGAPDVGQGCNRVPGTEQRAARHQIPWR